MARKPTGQVLVRRRQRGTVFALRFRAYGERRFVTLGTVDDGWSRGRAEEELANVLTDVRRGIWRPPDPDPEPQVPEVEPTFHEFASEWFAARAPSLAGRTREDYQWRLTNHLLPYFAGHRLSRITVAEVDRYRDTKAAEGLLAPQSINKTLTLLGQILDVADERDLIDRNPLRVNPRNRKLKAPKPRRVWLDRAHQFRALLDAAATVDERGRAVPRKAIIATLALGGLRVGELCELRWRHVDLAGRRLRVRGTKTDAADRDVDLVPALHEELLAHKARRGGAPHELVFPTATGRPRDKDNIRNRVLAPTVAEADYLLVERGQSPLPEGLTSHKLRHSFASLLVALGHDPRHVMGQLGHADAKFTLELYSHPVPTDERRRLAGLVGVEWAPLGTTPGKTPTADTPTASLPGVEATV